MNTKSKREIEWEPLSSLVMSKEFSEWWNGRVVGNPTPIKSTKETATEMLARNLAEVKATRANAANAQLIAAAPELLAAATVALLHLQRELHSGSDFGDDAHEALRLLKTAIAKTKGKV